MATFDDGKEDERLEKVVQEEMDKANHSDDDFSDDEENNNASTLFEKTLINANYMPMAGTVEKLIDNVLVANLRSANVHVRFNSIRLLTKAIKVIQPSDVNNLILVSANLLDS